MKSHLGILGVVMLMGAAAFWAEHEATALQYELAQADRRLSQLTRVDEAAAAEARQAEEALHRAENKLDLANAEAAVESRYGVGPARVWRMRVEALQRGMAGTPGEAVPELALLQLKDWIDAAVRAEGASEAQLRTVYAALRHTAYARVAEKVRMALQRYVKGSGGELPRDVQQLLPLLEPPVTAEMLSGYRLAGSGKAGAPEQEVLTCDLGTSTVTITLDTVSVHAKASVDASARLPDVASLLSGLDGSPGDNFLAEWQSTMQTAMTAIGPTMEQLFPEQTMAAMGDDVKAAVKRYVASHDQRPPESMADLQGSLPEAADLVQRLRMMVAHLEYALDHDGAFATDPARLSWYATGHSDTDLLKRMKLTVRGEHVDMNFDFDM